MVNGKHCHNWGKNKRGEEEEGRQRWSNVCPWYSILSRNTLVSFLHFFFVLFWNDGKHNSLFLPIFDPTIEITSFVKSSLICCIFRSISATYLAAEGYSWTKSLLSMWSIVSIIFFRTSVNWRALYVNSDSLLAFSILSCKDFVAGDRNRNVSLNLLISW